MPPRLNLKKEVSLIDFLVEAAKQRLLACAHDLSLGGLALALFRCAYNASSQTAVGFCLETEALQNKLIEPAKLRQDLFFFGETNSCAVLSAYPEKHIVLTELARKKKLPLHLIGTTSTEQNFDFGFFQVQAEQAIESFCNGFTGIF